MLSYSMVFTPVLSVSSLQFPEVVLEGDEAIFLEEYRSGRNENDSKSFCLEIGTWVRIPPPPPFIRLSEFSEGLIFLPGDISSLLNACPLHQTMFKKRCSHMGLTPV